MELRVSVLNLMPDTCNSVTKHMDTDFGVFKKLALRTVADGELKDDVNDIKLF